MFRRPLALLSALLLLGSCVAWASSYLPSSFVRYRGWWLDRKLADSSYVGLRCGSGELIVWRIHPKGQRPYKQYLNRTKPKFGFAQTTDSCELEGLFGIPWDAVQRVPFPLFGQVAWMPPWALVALSALHPACAAGMCFIKKHKRAPGMCGACGYDLTGNVSGVCPECGKQIEGGSLAARRDVPPLPGT